MAKYGSDFLGGGVSFGFGLPLPFVFFFGSTLGSTLGGFRTDPPGKYKEDNSKNRVQYFYYLIHISFA